MLAIIGVIVAVIAGILKLTHNYPNAIIWLIILAIILIGCDVAWGWNARGRRYRA